MIRSLLILIFFGLGSTAMAQSSRYQTCMDQVTQQPLSAYEDGLAWKFDGGGAPARHCIASALIAMGDVSRGAKRMEELGHAPELIDPQLRGEIFSQAAEGFLQLNQPGRALRSIDAGLGVLPESIELHLQRARALAAQGQDSAAEQELDGVLAGKPGHLLALTLRASVLIRQQKLDAAGRDVATALTLAPKDIDVLLLRGAHREAIRLAAQP